MNNPMGRREFLTAGARVGIGLGLGVSAGTAFAQQTETAPRAAGTDALGRGPGEGRGRSAPPKRMAKTTKLFLTPPSWPNAITTDPEGRGFWVQEQRHDNKQEAAWLLDRNGKVLHKVLTNCKDASGMAYGDGCIWSGANGESEIEHPTPPIEGIFQTDMNSKQISQRQIPFGPADNGGTTHGLAWENGKLWIYANRLEAMMRIDPKSWQVDYMFPVTRIPSLSQRLHGIEWDNGFIWQVTGTQKPDVPGYEGYTPGLIKYEVKTGQVVQIVEFVPGSCDIHDVTVDNGVLIGVDAGEHPGWSIDNPSYQHPGFPPINSPSGGYVFRIDLI